MKRLIAAWLVVYLLLALLALSGLARCGAGHCM